MQDLPEIRARSALGPADLAALAAIAPDSCRPGARLGLSHPALKPVTAMVAQHLANARPTRCLSLRKDDATNWGLGWHQDRVIAVADRQDLPGFTNWSCKSGQWHCEPPVPLLRAMRFVRVHLHPCDETNGAMEIAVGSHNAGVVPDAQASDIAARFAIRVSRAAPGDIQILPFLSLHRSRRNLSGAARRALRLDYAGFALPPLVLARRDLSHPRKPACAPSVKIW